MSRVKITEFKAKSIVLPQLGQEYEGLHIDTNDKNWPELIENLTSHSAYVVKVDQGVKKRGKNGLLMLNISLEKIKEAIETLKAKGFNTFLIEPFITHEQSDERYLSLQRVREGIQLWFHAQGGVEIEETSKDKSVEEFSVNNEQEIKVAAEATKISFDMLNAVIDVFKKEYFAYLEVNPLIIHDNSLNLLDLAVEVDSAGDYFVTTWNKGVFVQKNITIDQELAVMKLSEKSPSSFKLEVLNSDGAIWMLLSGGGASLVIADEYNNLGKGSMIGNYGEYSGAPNADETYEYAKQIVSLMLKSGASKKILLIAGGVANFTDVSITFKGIIRALEERVDELKKQNVTIFVRRGGPKQEKGLALIRDFATHNKLGGYVAGPELSLNEIVKKSIEAL